MKKTLDFIIDKLCWVPLLFERPFKRSDDDYIYQRDFLGEENHVRTLADIFLPITTMVNNGVEKIYSIKDTYFREEILIKVKYCIENRFWGIFAFTSSDGSEMGSDTYFSDPSLRVYLVTSSSNQQMIIVAKVTYKKLEILAAYPSVKSCLTSFKDRKLVYSKETNFIAL